MTAGHAQDTRESPATVRKATIAAAAGNTIETFDYGVYGYLTTILASRFFPEQTPGTALLSTLAVFGVAFVVRPLGSVLFGAMGDRLGRRAALVLTLALIAGSTAAIGVLPTAHTAGVLAPVLLVLCRLLQGLATGGEYSTAVTYVAEHSTTRRGALTSRVQIGSILGLVLAATLVLLLGSLLGDGAMAAWGWRLAFLAALPMGVIGLVIRLTLDETPEFQQIQQQAAVERAPLRETFTHHREALLVVFGLAAIQQVGYYVVFSYVQTYLIRLGHSTDRATLATLLALIVAMVVVACVGPWSDRVGRRPILVAACAALVVFAYPLFALLSATGNLAVVILVCAVMAIGPAAYTAVAPAAYTEAVPARVRATTFAIGYNLAAAALGGPALYVSGLLINLTHDRRAPAYFLMAGALISLLAALAVKRAPDGRAAGAGTEGGPAGRPPESGRIAAESGPPA